MTAEVRLYAVHDGKATRLVQAANPSQALRHVAKTAYSVAIPSQIELVALIQSGVKVEELDGKDAA